MADADYAALERIYESTMRQRREREEARRKPPAVHIYDGDWRYRGQVFGERDMSFEWIKNDTGSCHITLPAEHHIAQWVANYWDRETANVHVRMDKDGGRWCGTLADCVSEQDDNGDLTVTMNFLHDYEKMKHIDLWPNPLMPAGVQFPKAWIMAGPAIYVLKLTLFMNLFRHFGNLWQLPDDPLDFKSWVQGLNYKEWPMLVKPSSLLLDDSPWCIVSSRFKTFDEAAKDILADGRLMVKLDRWFTGDPQPWPGAGLKRDGQLIVDIVDKSGWWEQTSVGGTIAGGLVRTGVELAENLVDEARVHLQKYEDAEEYTLAGWLGIAPKQPWVVYRTNPPYNTAQSTSFTWQPATVGQITVGGHSSPGINESISIATKLVFNIMGSFILQPNLGSIIDDAASPIYEDTIGAFMSVKNPLRTRRLGWDHYLENFEDGADKAYTLSSLIALRSGFFKTRERTAHKMNIQDGAPYLVGDRGQGHFFLGDRVGGEIPGSKDGRVVVEQVTSIVLTQSADQPHQWEITTGDQETDQDPIDYLLGLSRDFFASIKELGLI